VLCRAGVAQAAAALLGQRRRRGAAVWRGRRGPSLQRDSARCSSYSVSAQSSALPGASPASDDAAVAPGRALIDLPAALGPVPASGGFHAATQEPPRHRSSAQGAATVSAAARPSGSGHLLEDALRAACGLADPARGGRADVMASAGGAAAAAHVRESPSATVGTVGGLRDRVSRPSVGDTAEGPKAGVASVNAGQVAARSERSHGLWPMDSVQNLLKCQGQPVVSTLSRALTHGSLPNTWRPLQSPNSPVVRTLPPGY